MFYNFITGQEMTHTIQGHNFSYILSSQSRNIYKSTMAILYNYGLVV